MRNQQFASRAYCGAARPVFKMASQQEKAFCVLRFEVSRSVITLQREFRAWFRKDTPCVCVCVCVCVYIYIYVYIQGVPGGEDLTSGECSLDQTIPI